MINTKIEIKSIGIKTELLSRRKGVKIDNVENRIHVPKTNHSVVCLEDILSWGMTVAKQMGSPEFIAHIHSSIRNKYNYKVNTIAACFHHPRYDRYSSGILYSRLFTQYFENMGCGNLLDEIEIVIDYEHEMISDPFPIWRNYNKQGSSLITGSGIWTIDFKEIYRDF